MIPVANSHRAGCPGATGPGLVPDYPEDCDADLTLADIERLEGDNWCRL